MCRLLLAAQRGLIVVKGNELSIAPESKEEGREEFLENRNVKYNCRERFHSRPMGKTGFGDNVVLAQFRIMV